MIIEKKCRPLINTLTLRVLPEVWGGEVKIFVVIRDMIFYPHFLFGCYSWFVFRRWGYPGSAPPPGPVKSMFLYLNCGEPLERRRIKPPGPPPRHDPAIILLCKIGIGGIFQIPRYVGTFLTTLQRIMFFSFAKKDLSFVYTMYI